MIAVYDCATYPLNFEFIPWLIDAERRRRRTTQPGPLQVAFANKDKLAARRTDAGGSGEAWLNEVMRPLLPMLGAVEAEPGSDTGWRFLSVERTLNDIVEAAINGEKVPLLQGDDHHRQMVIEDLDYIKPSGKWMLESPPITITLREAKFWPHRNSHVSAWLNFANELIAAGETVIFIRDYAMAYEPIDDHNIYYAASLKLPVRMALYELAKMNFFVSNGPAMLAFFSRVPYCVFMTHYAGMVGPQWPWAKSNQRMIYETDHYNNLITAWKNAK